MMRTDFWLPNISQISFNTVAERLDYISPGCIKIHLCKLLYFRTISVLCQTILDNPFADIHYRRIQPSMPDNVNTFRVIEM